MRKTRGLLIWLAVATFLAGGLPLAAPAPAPAQTKPAELKVGIVSFLSGAAAVFGVPGRNAAEWRIEKYNRDGGLGGVRSRPVYIDEAGGPEKQVAEIVQDGDGARPAAREAQP